MIIRVSKNLFKKWKNDNKLLEKKDIEKLVYFYLGHPDWDEIEKDYKVNKSEIDSDYSMAGVDVGLMGKGNINHLHILQFSEEGNGNPMYQIEFEDFNKDVSIETISKYTSKKSLEVGKPLVYLRQL